MTASLLRSATSGLRLVLVASFFLGPLAALGMAMSDGPVISKQGAGFVLLVSLQRQAMS